MYNGGDQTVTEEKASRSNSPSSLSLRFPGSALLCVGFVFGLVFLAVASAKSSCCHKLPYPEENVSDQAFQAGVSRSTLNGLAPCLLEPLPQPEDWNVLIGRACQGPCLDLGWAQLLLRLTGRMVERSTPEWKLRAIRMGGGGRDDCRLGRNSRCPGVHTCPWLSMAGTCDSLPTGFL